MAPDASSGHPLARLERWLTHVEALATERLPRDLQSPAQVGRAIERLSQVYTRTREQIAVAGRHPDALAARLRFFSPRDILKPVAPLTELADAQALPAGPEWRILDLGAGLGATSLGVLLFAADHPAGRSLRRVVIEAVDRDAAALKLFEALLVRLRTDLPFEVELETRVEDLRERSSARRPAAYDLIVAGLTLNELGAEPPQAAAHLAQWLQWLTPHGSLLILEPALRATSRALQQTRDALLAQDAPPHVFAPCTHADACPMLPNERDWCHVTAPVALPERLQILARSAGLRTEDLSYSYLVLQPGPPRMAATGSGTTPYRAVSGRLRSKGKLELMLCGTPGLIRLMRLDRHRTSSNAALDEFERGTRFEVAAVPDPRGRLRIGEAEALQHSFSPSDSLTGPERTP